MFSQDQLLERYRDKPGALALLRLLRRVSEHDGGSTRPILAALRSIYNGTRDPCDLELVCKRLERRDFLDVVSVMRFAFDVFEDDHIEMHSVFTDPSTMPKVLFG